ncbi:acyl-CoA thioesterase [Magnetospirillum sp. UT-4]|uniref:acyl-CoA thioesterase n=1 Tax=Magnetospirillum sp. UT-4 TaxID=2681467 RepID=UPI0013852929|nr:acyl-CoA thioesterase [Magnetospirillum sp. UT-4]CAA7626440.1 putative enzyme [Magnetospirillum sp. UT-4]
MTIEKSGSPTGRLSIRTVAMPADTNPHGAIFGGWLMAQMDLAGGTHAFHRARGPVVTVAVDAMTFHEPVFVGDELSCYTDVAKVGRTSLTVRVEAWVRRRWGDETQIKVTTGTYTFVAVDEAQNKRQVPPE